MERRDLAELVLVGGEVGGELLHTQILHGLRLAADSLPDASARIDLLRVRGCSLPPIRLSLSLSLLFMRGIGRGRFESCPLFHMGPAHPWHVSAHWRFGGSHGLVYYKIIVPASRLVNLRDFRDDGEVSSETFD
jgi:hypothetical protein